MAAKHATLSASGSPTWLGCPASAAMAKAFGVDKGSAAASEGTAAHALGEDCLRNKKHPSEYMGRKISVENDDGSESIFTVDKEMAEAVTVYTDYVMEKKGQSGALYIEQRVDFSRYVPQGFGTSDAIVEVVEKVKPAEKSKFKGKKTKRVLYVIDYKHGKGIYVPAFENSQLMLYAAGTLHTMEEVFLGDIDEIVCVVVQPRKSNVSEYRILPDELQEWLDDVVTPAAQTAWKLREACTKSKIDTEGYTLKHVLPEHYGPSDKACQWCKAKDICKERLRKGIAEIDDSFSDLTLEEQSDFENLELDPKNFVDLHSVTPAELAAIRKKTRPLLAWLKKLDEIIMERKSEGVDVGGLKAVQEPGARKWGSTDEDAQLSDEELLRLLKTAGLKKQHYEVISRPSPTETEKILKEIRPKDWEKRYKKLEKAAIVRPPKKPSLVDASHPGEDLYPVKTSAASDDTTSEQDDIDDLLGL